MAGCATEATCSNTVGGFACTCKPGYAGDGKTCADINECATNNGGCSADANCANTPGSFTYSPDGRYLYGSAYTTGASNLFRIEVATQKLEALSNTETGLFRPSPLPGPGFIPSTPGLLRSQARPEGEEGPGHLRRRRQDGDAEAREPRLQGGGPATPRAGCRHGRTVHTRFCRAE